MKKMIVSVVLLLLAGVCIAGIYRHDREKKRYIELAHRKQFDCVGQVFVNTAERGSCVLIDKQFVLTAAHVFFQDDSAHPEKFFFAFNSLKYAAKKIMKHPLYDLDGEKKYDLAVVELQRPVDSIVPASLYGMHDELHADVIGVGYGGICRADSPVSSVPYDKAEKFAGENVVDTIGGYIVNGYGAILYCDFDCPPGSKYYGKCNKMGSSIPKELEYVVNGGDSGGGLFHEGKSGWKLIGICSEGGVNIDQFVETFYYGQVMKWTRVSVFINWIKSCEHNR